MRVEKKALNDALRVLGKVVCQTCPVELYRSIRFVGDADGVMAMATDGVEVVSVILDAFAETEIDFCVPFKELKDLVRMGRSETIELTGKFIEFPELEEPSADAISAILPVNFGELLTQIAVLNVILIVSSPGMTVISAATVVRSLMNRNHQSIN